MEPQLVVITLLVGFCLGLIVGVTLSAPRITH